jgi:5-methyltetrahydropteroyltriglutamate--homocysteine methyltransferase
MASEPDKKCVLTIIRKIIRPEHLVFIGVIDPINPAIETPSQVRDRILEAASILHVTSLGSTDDCGFSPFADDISTARDTAFSKIRARVEGTALADRELGL